MFAIKHDDLRSTATKDLVAYHVAEMQRNSPPCHVFALDSSGLLAPDVDLYTAWEGDKLAAMGALRDLHDGTGEIKSMRTHPQYARRGAGAAVLEHIIAEARRRRYSRISLETGSGEAFEPAIALYRKRGFRSGAAFGTYTKSDFNQFMHLELKPED